MKQISQRWGVEIKRYEITLINLSTDFVKLMNLEADSERFARKLMLEAKAFEVSSKNNAIRDKEKTINQKKAESQKIKLNLNALATKVGILNKEIENKNIDTKSLDLKLK